MASAGAIGSAACDALLAEAAAAADERALAILSQLVANASAERTAAERH